MSPLFIAGEILLQIVPEQVELRVTGTPEGTNPADVCRVKNELITKYCGCVVTWLPLLRYCWLSQLAGAAAEVAVGVVFNDGSVIGGVRVDEAALDAVAATEFDGVPVASDVGLAALDRAAD